MTAREGHIVYAWVVDGISAILVTDEALDDTWAVAQGFLTTVVGLRLPSGMSCGIDLRAGLLTDDTGTIAVDDLANELAPIFRPARDAAALVTTLEPGTVGGASLYSKHVGLEFIGSAGARRQYSCVPGFAVGLKHYGENEASNNGLGATPVSDSPQLWTGRRFCVYRIKYTGGAWQALSAAKRVWWGTLRGQGQYRKGRWSFSCFGPQSWCGGNLGRGVFSDPLPVRPAISIDSTTPPGEHWISASLDVVALDDITNVIHNYADFSDATDSTYLVGAASYADVAAAFNSFFDDLCVVSKDAGVVFNINGNDIFFSTVDGAAGVTIAWDRGNANSGVGDNYVTGGTTLTATPRMRVRASETAWRTLGYDVRTQNSDRDPVANWEQYGQFIEAGQPWAGYWIGTFYAASPKAMLAYEEDNFEGALESSFESGAGGRRWPPAYPGGAAAFTGQPGQEFSILQAFEPVLLAGTFSRPLPQDPDDNTAPYSLEGTLDVTDQALLVLEGPYRRRGDEDQVDPVEGYAFELDRERREGKTQQVIRVGYKRNADGSIAAGADGYPVLVVYQWYDPRLFGLDWKPISGSWGTFLSAPIDADTITCRPLLAWETRDGADRITEVIRRVLLTTGTFGGWFANVGLTTPLYGLDGAPVYPSPGDNDDGGGVPGDAEAASLGLGVPASMVASEASLLAVEGVLNPDLRRCKVAAVGLLSARDLFSRLLSPTGLCFSLSGGKYGLIDAWDLPTPSGSTLSITVENYAGQAGKNPETPQQSLRKWGPIDRLEIKGRIDPVSKTYKVETERPSTDSGSVYRSQQIRQQIQGDYLVHPGVPIVGNSWLGNITTRWRKGFEFWGTDLSEVTVKLHAEDAIDVWPGDSVVLTDDELVSTDGSYGLSSAACRVLGRIFDGERETITLRLLVGDPANLRLYAPSAVVTRYDDAEDTAAYRLFCNDAEFSDRNGTGFDVEGFAEPSWSVEGGDASIEIFQFDGVSWSGGIYGVVDTVTASAGACLITLTGALTGATFYRDKHSIVVLREYANQAAAWVLRWYAPITEADHTHSSGTAGIPFMGV